MTIARHTDRDRSRNDELTPIVGLVTQRVKVERAPKRLRRRGRFDPRERIAISSGAFTLRRPRRSSRRMAGNAL